MVKLTKIMWLKLNLYFLKNKRNNALLDISVNQAKIVSRVNNLEDIRPYFFKEIDSKINYKKRQIVTISRRHQKRCLSL